MKHTFYGFDNGFSKHIVNILCMVMIQIPLSEALATRSLDDIVQTTSVNLVWNFKPLHVAGLTTLCHCYCQVLMCCWVSNYVLVND